MISIRCIFLDCMQNTPSFFSSMFDNETSLLPGAAEGVLMQGMLELTVLIILWLTFATFFRQIAF